MTTIPIQERMWNAFRANGQTLEWHFFPFSGHGFIDPGAIGYHLHCTELAWPLAADFLARELDPDGGLDWSTPSPVWSKSPSCEKD